MCVKAAVALDGTGATRCTMSTSLYFFKMPISHEVLAELLSSPNFNTWLCQVSDPILERELVLLREELADKEREIQAINMCVSLCSATTVADVWSLVCVFVCVRVCVCFLFLLKVD